MATFDFHRLNYGVNTDDIIARVLNYGPLKNLKVLKPTDSEFSLAQGGTKVKYLGEDLKYNDKNDPKAGVIESVEVIAPKGYEYLRFKITGLDIDIGDMKDAFKSATPADDLAFVAGIFKGDDTFIGTDLDDKFYGLGGKDTMNGDKGNDSLDGGGGRDVLRGQSGNDELKGGSGKDFFVFDTSAKSTNNVDIILDFNSADDTIRLDSASIYDHLGGKGTLGGSFFHVGDPAAFKNGGIIYDANGDLWYDPSDRQEVKFAHLDGAPTLTAADFVIV